MEPKQALRELVEAELELESLMIDRADRMRGRRRRRAFEQIAAFQDATKADLRRFERAWLARD